MVVKLLKVLLLFGELFFQSFSLSYEATDPKGPQHWGLISPNCDGRRQSPLNINLLISKPVIGSPISMLGARKRPKSIKIENDGHGTKYSMIYSDGIQRAILGGPLGNELYTLLSFHFHWISEHTVKSKHYDAELHIVFFNLKYGTFEEALKRHDGLAVLGFFLSVMSTFRLKRKQFCIKLFSASL